MPTRRILAAKEEGIAEIPCVFADHLSERRRKPISLRTTAWRWMPGWDEELLRVEIESLQGMDFDPLLTGFDEKELADLFGTDDEAKEDDFDVEAELEKPCFSKAGDIWRLGKHTVICGIPQTRRRSVCFLETRRSTWSARTPRIC